jgi:putative ABC transport system ATP-binding protein
MSTEPFIICDNLVKIYKVANLEVFALQGLDLLVAPGELMAIIGASGSGKSTLMNTLGGLDRPSAGRVWVDGNDLLKMSDAALNRYRRAKVGFVWQQGARNLIPYLSASENVELPMTLAGKAKTKKRRADELLEMVGLSERRHHYIATLSGGEQQRVAIAVALANSPTLLLADEPTGEVDSQTALVIYDTFKRLNQDLKLTTIIVSHDPTIARHVSRVVAIRDGKLASETIRQAAAASATTEAETNGDAPPQDVYEELVVLDSAGRLQIPKDYLQQFNIQGRARLEVREDGILIVPAGTAGEDRLTETQAGNLIPTARRRGLRDFVARLRPSKAA